MVMVIGNFPRNPHVCLSVCQLALVCRQLTHRLVGQSVCHSRKGWNWKFLDHFFQKKNNVDKTLCPSVCILYVHMRRPIAKIFLVDILINFTFLILTE